MADEATQLQVAAQIEQMVDPYSRDLDIPGQICSTNCILMWLPCVRRVGAAWSAWSTTVGHIFPGLGLCYADRGQRPIAGG